MAVKAPEQIIPLLQENGFLKSKWAVEEFKANLLMGHSEIWLTNGVLDFKFILDGRSQKYVAHNFRRLVDRNLNEMIDKINN